jgi:Undecaprenyl-phosphate glucose phosphotransferase
VHRSVRSVIRESGALGFPLPSGRRGNATERQESAMVRRLSLYECYFRIFCLLLPLLAFVICGFALTRMGFIQPTAGSYASTQLRILCLSFTLIWILCSLHFRITELEALYSDSVGLRNCLKAIAWTYMSGLSALFFYRAASISRLMLGSSALVLLALLLLLRFCFRRLLQQSNALEQPVRVVMVGADDFARRAAERLTSSRLVPCKMVAFVRIPGQQEAPADEAVPVLELDWLLDCDMRHFADDIVIAGSPQALAILSGLIERLRELAVPIRFCIDFGSDVKVRDRLIRLDGTHILDVQVAPSETVSYLVLKRAFDVVFSLFALAVAAVPMLVMAAAIKLSSPGPVLFAQERVGINGRLFRMHKFRTMRVAPAEESDTRWTTADDDRRTAVGAFLRRFSLDELPQFFNVLYGDMSVVGPRPERPFYVRKFNGEIEDYNTRHHLKSGITGWAQVNGLRGDTSVAKRLEHDLYYLDNWSLIFDIKIILMTIYSGFSAQNAY